ncbi:MAG: hypothetical protein JWO06_485 [Bacteroidota bacterium]|nr:hypothetical protein [Bacteroidota bacterium]
MNKILLALALCVTLSACNDKKSKTEPVDIVSIKTAQHINIPGTRIYIIPPVGYKTANGFTGLQKGNNAYIQMYDLVGGNFNTNAATFTKKSFEKQGAQVFEFKDMTVNNYPARYVSMQGEKNSKAISIVFGDTTFSVMIMAMYPATDDKAADDIKKAFATIYYDKDLKVDPFASAFFKLNDSVSTFKFAKSASGFFVYTLNGENKKSLGDDPFVNVTPLPKDTSMTARSISEMFVTKLAQYGFTTQQVKNPSYAPVNGLPAFESEVYGSLNGKKCLIYQLAVTTTDKAVIIQGIVKSDFENQLAEIKKLARTIQLK